MSLTPIENSESLRIGSVDFVSPDEIKVALDIETPESVALNAGYPRPFPRVNSYVLIPSEDGFLVGQVEWITIEKSPYPKRQGMRDFGLVDLPYPMRRMSLNPLGMLKNSSSDKNENYSFRRGTEAFPSVGDSVLLPSQKQLKSIVESGENQRVKIGISPLAGNADVCIDPDRLFGRHLAVLGNTGSGKSCSVAGLIRWSLEAAMRVHESPNARFIILDPNGEYSKAFSNTAGNLASRVYKVNPMSNESQLRVPLWFWNSAEWVALTQASGKTQSPILKRALREIKSGQKVCDNQSNEEKILMLRRYLSSNYISINSSLKNGSIRSEETKFGFRLKAIEADLAIKQTDFPQYSKHINSIRTQISIALKDTFQSFTSAGGQLVEYYRAFQENQITTILTEIRNCLESLGGIIYQEGPSEDMPIPFSGADFADHIQMIAEEQNVTQYLDFLVMRIRTMLSEARFKSVIGDSEAEDLTAWLSSYIGNCDVDGKYITIIDLSIVPTEIIHIVTAVIARVVFEALQRYRKLNQDGKTLPTVLVMEEAHTFVKRYNDGGDNHDAASVCCKVFERIAREGRKFGLGLVLSSQRPSELSPTVLSQCNTFLLHRISNDRDQELVHKLVPDNLRGLLRDLPTLPSQNAILLGWASELPVLVRMNDLPSNQTPRSDDPDFWDVWTRSDTGERDVNWKKVADDWQGKQTTE